jgi:hypothetical protein
MVNRKFSKFARFGAAGLVVAVLGGLFQIDVRSATSWNPGDVFVGIDNESFDPPTLSQYSTFTSTMTPTGTIGLTDITSYTTGCAVDPTIQDGDLWSAGFWDRKITEVSSLDHSIVKQIDATPYLSFAADPTASNCPLSGDPRTCAGAVESMVFDQNGTFYVGTAYGLHPVLHFDKAGNLLDSYDVDITGIRGPEYVDLGADQHTLYYAGVDDARLSPLAIHRYDLATRTQLDDIPLSENGQAVASLLLGIRVLPPGDGTGGYIIATDAHVYRVNPSGQVILDFIDTPDFLQRVGIDYRFFIDANLSNDGQYLWSAVYPQVDVDTSVTVPGKLFKFHIPTGTVQGGPIDLGAVGDLQTVDALCVYHEYIASVEQPNCAVNPSDIRCHPVADCTLPGSLGNPSCAVPGAPVMTYPTPDGTTFVSGQTGGAANVQVLASLFVGDANVPASPGPRKYAASGLPVGAAIDSDTGLISGTIVGVGTFNVTITVTDQSNTRSATAHFTWKIGNTPPTIASPLPDQTSPLGLLIPTIGLSAVDPDTADTVTFTLSFGAAPVSGLMVEALDSRHARIKGTPTLPSGYACPSGTCGNFLVTVHASDGHTPEAPSQTTTFTWTITNQAPSAPLQTSLPASLTVHPGAAVSIQFTSSDPNHDPVNWSIQTTPSVPDFIINPATGLIGGYPVTLGTYSIKVIADDLHGGVSSTTVSVSVANAAPPAPTLIGGSLNVHIGGAASFQVRSIDPDGDAVTYAVASVPPIPGLSISPAGVVTGQPAALLLSYQVTVTASDRFGGTSFSIFTLTVTNNPPNVPAIAGGSQTIHIGTSAALQITSTDPDGDAVHYGLVVTPPLGVVNSNLSINAATGLISGTPPALGAYQLLVTASDGLPNGASSKTFTLIVANQPPTVPVLQPPASSLNILLGTSASIQFKSTDPDADPIAYSLTVTPPIGVLSSNLSISSSGLITGIPPAAGNYALTVMASDPFGGSASASPVTLVVSSNRPPVCTTAVASPSSLWPPNHRLVAIAINSVTDPDGNPITFTINSILQDEPTYGPGDAGDGNTTTDGLIVNGSQAQVRAERSGSGNGRVYVIGFTARDPSGATCTGTVKVGVPHDQSGPAAVDSLVRYNSLVSAGPPLQGPGFNLPPVYVKPGNQTTRVGAAVSLATVATDLNLDTLTYSAVGLPPGLAISSTTGRITGSPTTAGSSPITLTVSDPFGGSSSVSFTWIVQANRAPVVVTDTTTISKGASVTIQVLANDSDPDGDSLTLTSVQDPPHGTATKSGSTITYKPDTNFVGTDQFTYVVSDGHGGTATGTVKVTVVAHSDGDGCDHDKHRNGHYDGDGCEHDRLHHH